PGHVVRRIPPPPALPLVVAPWPANRPEHFAPADVGEPAHREVVVDAGRAVLGAVHLLEGTRRPHPVHHRQAADTIGLSLLISTRRRTSPVEIDKQTDSFRAYEKGQLFRRLEDARGGRTKRSAR